MLRFQLLEPEGPTRRLRLALDHSAVETPLFITVVSDGTANGMMPHCPKNPLFRMRLLAGKSASFEQPSVLA